MAAPTLDELAVSLEALRADGVLTAKGLADLKQRLYAKGQASLGHAVTHGNEDHLAAYLSTIAGIAAGGDLSGTYVNPSVAALHETSGPTMLTIGTITDGQFLKRVGATLVSGAITVTNALLDGANHTDTLAGAVVRGDLIVGNSTPKWARKAIGAANSVLWTDGTDPSWQTVPRLAGIADTGGTTRYATATGSPQNTFTGDVLMSGQWGNVDSGAFVLTAGYYGAIAFQPTNTAGTVGLGLYVGQAIAAATANVVAGLQGKVAINNVTTGLNAFGLDFQASITSLANATYTATEVTCIRIANVITSGNNNTTVTAMNGVSFAAPTLTGGLAITTYTGFKMAGSGSTKITKAVGVSLGSFSGAGVVWAPIEAAGPARTTDTDGSFHRNNFMIGSITRAFGGGDGVIGLANATTNPSTNPSGGLVIYANGGDLTVRTSGGVVSAIGAANILPGTTQLTPSAQQSIAVSAAIVANATVVQISTTTAANMTATPTIADGTDGQILIIVNTGANTFTLQDQGTLANSNLRMSTATYAVATRDNIKFMYSAAIGDWIEISRTNVL